MIGIFMIFTAKTGCRTLCRGTRARLDDDYYFAGQYSAVGTVAQNEPWLNFERAILANDQTVRIHFNMTEVQAAPGNELRLSTKLMWYGSGTGWPTTPVTFRLKWNDNLVASGDNGATAADVTNVVSTFSAASVNAGAENTVTLERDSGGWQWVCIDFVKAEVALTDPSLLIISFTADPTHVTPRDRVTLSWKTDPAASLEIDQGVGVVTSDPVTGLGSIDVFPTAPTTYTMTATKGTAVLHASVTVVATLINSFTATPNSIRIDDPVTLAWNAVPEASLMIEPGIGSVDAQTVNGIGSLQVNPASTTTYNLIATRGDDVTVESVTVNVNPRKLLWQLGYNDGQNADFHQELVVNPPPGSPTAIDMDYYFAGQYPDPIGFLPTSEYWTNFQRSLTIWGIDTTRIHFNLTEAQAAPGNNLFFTFKLYGFNNDPLCCNTDPTAPITANWNDVQVLGPVDVTNPTTEQLGPLLGSSVHAVPGANVVSVSRTAVGNAWIQFDYLMAEVEMTDPTAGLITSFQASSTFAYPEQKVTLTWKVDPLADSVAISGIGDVSGYTVNGIGSLDIYPTATSDYTLTVTRGAATLNQSVHVAVAMIRGFTISRTTILKGESVTLNWQVDPTASVSLAPTYGNVGAQTTAGVGSLTVTPAGTTTYTLTVNKPGYSAQASVTVVVDPYNRVWELGYEDNSQAEFAQEGGGVNPPPGSPAATDNDYYFAGTYAAFGTIGQEVTATNMFGYFERALKPSEYLTRIHFNLTEAEAGPDSIFRLTFRLFGFNTDPTYNTAPVPWVTAAWNDTVVSSNVNVTDPTLIQTTFIADDVGALPGENTLTIQRSLEGNEWIQFDYVKLEAYNPSAHIWQLGYNDNNTGDFVQESGTLEPAPGSPTARDNDYYFAGIYPALATPLVAANEPWANFERALLNGQIGGFNEQITRIHYNLTAAEAAPGNDLYVTFKLFAFNNDPGCCDAGPTATYWANWNDTEVLPATVVIDPTTVRIGPVRTEAAGAVPGANTLTIQRGVDGNAWVCYDYIQTAVVMPNAGGLRINQFAWDAFGFAITWNSVPGKTYQVWTSSDLQNWTLLQDSYPPGGATDVLTSYTDTTATPSGAPRFYKIVDFTPSPAFTDNFESGAPGWEVIDQTFTDTTWVLGTPQKAPAAAHSGANAYCTDLVNTYIAGTDIILRSPVIDLTGVTSAILEFWDYRDIAADPDSGSVEIMDETGTVYVGTPPVWRKGLTSGGVWQKERVTLPPEAMNRTIRLQFRFYGLNGGSGGWFIDDVVVQPK